MSQRENYSYPVARIRTMERNFIESAIMQRMLDASDIRSAIKILTETTYARHFAESSQGDSFESALEAELLSTYRELNSFVPDKELTHILQLPYDLHNLKVLLKSSFNVKSGGRRRWDLLTELGSIPVDHLVSCVEEENYHLLPYHLPQTVMDCVTRLEQTGDMVEVERILDAGLFSIMLDLAVRLEEPGIVKWVKARIDSENIRNLLRLQRFEVTAATAESYLHPGGMVSPNILIQLFPEPFDSWGRSIAYSDVGMALNQIPENDDFDLLITMLEKTLDNYCQDILHKARYSPNAPENILSFLWAKEMEIKNIRTILVAKSGKFSREDIRGLLRNGY